MIQATVLILAAVYVLVNLLVDITYRLLNPRIRLA
jgi:peptide/nickel transport system permease protein